MDLLTRFSHPMGSCSSSLMFDLFHTVNKTSRLSVTLRAHGPGKNIWTHKTITIDTRAVVSGENGGKNTYWRSLRPAILCCVAEVKLGKHFIKIQNNTKTNAFVRVQGVGVKPCKQHKRRMVKNPNHHNIFQRQSKTNHTGFTVIPDDRVNKNPN